jgi:hypothetical protein
MEKLVVVTQTEKWFGVTCSCTFAGTLVVSIPVNAM